LHPVGITAGAVEPVVEDDHELGVIPARLASVLDDQRRAQPAVELGVDMRMGQYVPGWARANS
jgi:hypothetical protein